MIASGSPRISRRVPSMAACGGLLGRTLARVWAGSAAAALDPAVLKGLAADDFDARQAAITQEISEIVGGAAALQ